MPEDQPVVDEEFAAEDAEEDDAGDDVCDEVVQTETGRDLTGALFKEDQHERDQCHVEGIELCQPCDDDRREAVAACRIRCDGMFIACDDDEAAETADRAGDQHGTDRDLRDVDTRVARGIFGFADDGDFIAVFGILMDKVDEGYFRFPW